MKTHEPFRAKAAWRERNEGAEAPGDGQNVSRYVEPLHVPEPGTVGLPITDDHAAETTTEPPAVTPPPGVVVDPPPTPGGTKPADPATPANPGDGKGPKKVAEGLTTQNAPGLLGRRKS